MLIKGKTNRGSFTKEIKREFNLNCKECNNLFVSLSGSRRFCDSCIEEKTKCLECGQKKSLYDKFCNNSCAGKWKYKNLPQVRTAHLASKSRTPETFKKIGQHFKGKIRENFRGENNPCWKGGTYRNERHTLMGRVEYKNWRESIFKRDDYTCVLCGKKGGNLNADHIIPYYIDKTKALDIDNGRTLCVPCHKKQDTYGHKVKTRYCLK